MFTIIITYVFLSMSVLGFVLTVFDRICARVFNKFRIHETILFIIACLLGALGVMLGLFLAKRDVYKPEFRLGIPAIALGETVLMFWMVPGFFQTVLQILGV